MKFTLEKSAVAFAEAKRYIPGGVNSPVRSFRGVGGTPPFIAKAEEEGMTAATRVHCQSGRQPDL